MKAILTNRQTQVVCLVCDGTTHREIARKLGISIHSVSWHLDEVYKKTLRLAGGPGVAKLVKWALKNGYTTL